MSDIETDSGEVCTKITRIEHNLGFVFESVEVSEWNLTESLGQSDDSRRNVAGLPVRDGTVHRPVSPVRVKQTLVKRQVIKGFLHDVDIGAEGVLLLLT